MMAEEPIEIIEETPDPYPWDTRLEGCAIRNASPVEGQEDQLNCEVEHPAYGWIPITVTAEEYPNLYKRVKDALQS